MSKPSAPLPLIAVAVIVAVLATIVAGCGSSTTAASSSPSAGMTTPATVITPASGWPQVTSADFVTSITNPWFPLTTGASWVSKGIKDGRPTVDTYTVTGQTKVILGVTCSVIADTLTTNGKVVEKTSDWYAQDKQGNVWYFGEDTAEYNLDGSVKSTAGTWEAGVKGAQPGIFMPANPQVGQSGYQEYLPGQALDHYKIISMTASVKVPAGSFTQALQTEETTALEPGVLDHKWYVKGIGQVAEITVKGPKETSLLVSYHKP
jgi:hypothetical protein